MPCIKIGDLVKVKDYDTDLVGIVLEREPPSGKSDGYITAQIGIKWFGGHGKMDWEPEAWLEILSEGR